jgi:apolipoprotein N-acyltransferase
MAGFLQKTSDWLRGRRGWGRLGIAFLFGALASFGFAPYNLVFLLWLSFPALVFLLQGVSDWRRAFATGWWFAFGLMVFSLYWIAGCLFVDIKTFWWALLPAIAGLPACFSLYYAIAAALAWRWGVKRIDGILFLGLAWFLADYARGTLFTGFPWDLMGYVWSSSLPVLQIASVAGIYGLTLLTLLFAVAPACLLVPERKKEARILFGGFCCLFLGMALWGGWRVSETKRSFVQGARVRLVQEGVPERARWNRAERDERFEKLLDLSFGPAEKPVSLVVWPESATSFYLEEDAIHRGEIAARMTPGSKLITGLVRHDFPPSGEIAYYNALMVMDDKADILASYDKAHLVPFGEYMPFRSLVGHGAIAGMGSDFSAGPGPRTLHVSGLPPFSPLICYEAIFPGDAVDGKDPPRLMVNITDDAWYQYTTGPDQHFAIARVRAIETGLPLIRVADMGTNAVVDGVGRIVAERASDEAGFIDSDLPEPLEAQTLFARNGNSISDGMILFVALLLALARFRAARKSET